jgi:Tfp pilus assembly protein PilN
LRKVRIDFAARSVQRTLFHTPLRAWLLAALALVLCVLAALAGWRLLEERRIDAELAGAARARATATLNAPQAAPAPRIAEAQAVAVNAAVLQLNLPWRELHDAVAAATPDSIALLALEPDAKKHSLRITAEAKGSAEMVAYVASLKQQDMFAAVALTRHEINDQDPNQPIRFQLDAEWRTR